MFFKWHFRRQTNVIEYDITRTGLHGGHMKGETEIEFVLNNVIRIM